MSDEPIALPVATATTLHERDMARTAEAVERLLALHNEERPDG